MTVFLNKKSTTLAFKIIENVKKLRKNKSNVLSFSFGLRMKEDEQWLKRFVTRNDNDETLCVCCYQ